MGNIQNIQKYSHCILGRYELRPPTPEEEKKNHMAGIDAEQYYEATSTGGATPFRFLAELKMTQNGQRLFDCYYSALKEVCNTVMQLTEEFVKKNNINIDHAQISRVKKLKNRLAIRIRVFVPHVYNDKIDTEVLFYIKGSAKGEKDFYKVCEAVGVLTVSKLAQALSAPLGEADQATSSTL